MSFTYTTNNYNELPTFLSDQGVTLVLRIVGIAETAVGTELKLKELVTELPLVTNTIQIRLIFGVVTSI